MSESESALFWFGYGVSAEAAVEFAWATFGRRVRYPIANVTDPFFGVEDEP